MSGDENMINAFNNNEDIHASTAAKVFNIEIGKSQKSKESCENCEFWNHLWSFCIWVE